MNLKLNKTVKVLKLAASALWWLVLVSLAILLVNICGAKLTGNVPSVFGYSVMNIISGSMEDEIPKDSYILIKKVSPEKIEKNDIICFYSTDPKIYGIPNTHRVVEEPIITDSGIEFITKGDANPVNDTETAKGDRLIGVYVKSLDGLTSFANALSAKTIVIVIICLQICIIAMAAYAFVISKKKENDTGSDNKN